MRPTLPRCEPSPEGGALMISAGRRNVSAFRRKGENNQKYPTVEYQRGVLWMHVVSGSVRNPATHAVHAVAAVR
jgi:hypothetical protein